MSPELLKKYHLGQCTADEKVQILLWLQDGSSLEDVNETAEYLAEKDIANQRIKQKLSAATGIASLSRSKPKIWPIIFRIAATFLLIAGLTAIWMWQHEPATINKDNDLALVVPYGKRSELSLPDGSKIFLNAGSTLHYPNSFSDTIREVSLIGEAYFEISPDAARPFVVNIAQKTAVKVLGTAFNVQAYEDNENIEISVREGKVYFSDLQHPQQGLMLTAGQSASFQKLKQRLAYTGMTDMDGIATWKTNTLVFESERLEDICKKLKRWYNYDIQINDQAQKIKRYSGLFQDPDLDTLLNHLKFALGFDYRIDEQNKRVTIN